MTYQPSEEVHHYRDQRLRVDRLSQEMDRIRRNAREKLVQLPDESVRPGAEPFGRRFLLEGSKEKFRDGRRSTEFEKHRFHHDYTRAKGVKGNYQSDLSSDMGERISRDPEDPGFTSRSAVRDEFTALCDKLGVK